MAENNSKKNRWAVCIISSREDCSVLLATLKYTLKACPNNTAIIDVIVNGNKNLADELVNRIKLTKCEDILENKVRIWCINIPDKAMAWNCYINQIWNGSELVFFIDGYVQPHKNSLSRMESKLSAQSEALAITGVPTCGRTANRLCEAMLREGGLHGNLFAIKGIVVNKMKKIGFNLPIGIYRVDSVIGAVIAFNLDPSANEWDIKKRIIVSREVTWNVPSLNRFSFLYLKTSLKRRVRQSQGVLENLAVKQHLAILRKAPGDMPKTVKLLIEKWIKGETVYNRIKLFIDPFVLYSYYNLINKKELIDIKVKELKLKN